MAYIVPGANAPARLVNLRAAVRRRLGFGTDTQTFTDDMADDAISDGLRAVNEHWPVIGVGSFVTVAGQQTYSGILPVGGRELVEVFWCGIGCGCSDTFWGGFPGWLDGTLWPLLANISEEGVYYSVQPSILVEIRRHESYIRKWFGAQGAIADRDTVCLEPKPGQAGIHVYFVYTSNRFDLAENITDEIPALVDAFWARVLWSGSNALSAGNAAITRVQGADGVSVTLTAAAAAQINADRYAQDFARVIPLTLPGLWANVGCP